jgi:transforming growth factor-beta-induced protein
MKCLGLLCLGLLLLISGCSSSDVESSNSVAGIIARTANLNTLEGALETSDLTDLLADSSGEYTLFAPTDEAFAALGNLPEGEALTRLLQYHALSENLGSSALRANTTGTLETIEGSTITLKVENGKILLNDSTELVTTDLEASNGVVHIISKVLIIPPTAQ